MPVPHPLCEAIGLELEVQLLSEEEAYAFLREINRTGLKNWRAVHDGSTQQTFYFLPGLSFPFLTAKKPYLNSKSCGAELVSPIIDTTINDPLTILKPIYDGLYELGDWPSLKTSVHVHVNATGLPVYVLKNIINIWQRLEATFFRLSAAEMGFHRGEKQKGFLYCRPLTNPLVVASDGCFRLSYSADSLLSSKTLKEFFIAYGNSPVDINPSKYSPPRYSALNFFSFIDKGSIEFRTFNQTINPKLVCAWIEICKAVVKQAMGKPFLDYPIQLLGDSPDFTLQNLQFMLELTDEVMLELETTWVKTNWINYKPKRVLTHVRDHNTIVWDADNRNLIPPKIEEPVYYFNQNNGFEATKYKTFNEFRNGEGNIVNFNEDEI